MDEGTGVVATDVAGGNNGALVGGVSWQDGRFGKAVRFDGSSGFVSTQATGAMLGIDGKKSRTISFWTFVEDGNPKSQPGFYGYGERSCPGENRFWECVILRMVVIPNYYRSTFVGTLGYTIITT